MRAIHIFILALATVAVAGCATSTPGVSPTPAPSPTPVVSSPTAQVPTPTAQAPLASSVTIKSFSFSPGTVTVARGGTVTWTNDDATTHTVKFADGESQGLQKGGTYSKKFDTAGSFDYSCGIHPGMRGTVMVV